MRAIPLLALAVSLGAADCSRTSTGLIPLDALGGGLYRGFSGGFYPAGSNRRPAAHEAAGRRIASEILPRNAAGDLDPNGRVVLLSIGMSNATQEYSAFRSMADRDPQKSRRLVIVDGAQGGQTPSRILANPLPFWSTVDQRLAAAGVTAAQVQAAWLKEAEAGPTQPFPDHARQLQGGLAALIKSLRPRFPNLRLLYLSSRTYGGYASTPLNPEPYAYESGFAVKWTIEQQVQGADPELSYEAGRAPWMSWGPYLWADGLNGRADGLVWACADFGEDGTHPSPSGRDKVARLLLDFFKTDPTAWPWFAEPVAPGTPPAPAALVSAASYAPGVAPGSIASLFGADLAAGEGGATSLPLPHWMAGATVEIDGAPALLLYVSPGQINLVLPRDAGTGSAVVTVNGTASPPLSFELRPEAPALFTVDGRRAAALHADYRPVTEQDPARRGAPLLLFATGLGGSRPQVRLGGASAAITYAGPAPGIPGLEQINVVVPNEAPAGGAVTLELAAGSVAAAPVAVPVL